MLSAVSVQYTECKFKYNTRFIVIIMVQVYEYTCLNQFIRLFVVFKLSLDIYIINFSLDFCLFLKEKKNKFFSLLFECISVTMLDHSFRIHFAGRSA